MVFNAIFINISVISWHSVLLAHPEKNTITLNPKFLDFLGITMVTLSKNKIEILFG